jgi:hypothetical protein
MSVTKIKIAIVSAIVLAALATPFVVRQYKIKQLQEENEIPKRNTCISNLRLIDSAKQQWALQYGKQKNDTPTMEDLRIYFGHGTNGEPPICPDGGVYTIGSVGEKPTCNIPGHLLP